MTARQATTGLSDPETAAPPLGGFAPLENGDRLTRCEFERLYTARPDIHKAELIEGVVYMPSPVRARGHAGPVGIMTTWLVTYKASTPGVSVLVDATVRLDRDNEPQPDVLLRMESEAGGQSRLSEDDYVEGPPELIVEVAASSAAYDLHDKLRVYRRNGVLEYVVWRVHDRAVDWFVLTDDEYRPLAPDAHGVLHSPHFPGLRLALEALLAGDVTGVLATLQDGLGTPEHAAQTPRGRRVGRG